MKIPKLLKELNKAHEKYAKNINYNAYDEFITKENTKEWFESWCNTKMNENKFLLFGSDDTVGVMAIWNVRDSKDLHIQPIVFFGQDGDAKVVAKNIFELMWLFANELGPQEVAEFGFLKREENKELLKLANKYATTCQKDPKSIIEGANQEFADFESNFYRT